ncbi:MAG TPA: NADH-quinone oxidoreductase subunit N, partial [Desulfobulbus sp.]|nr:NADH-quinone oxidoreductase subunit N [Desulfobulbus sp.]
MAILPELALIAGALAFFALSLSKSLDSTQVKNSAVVFGFIILICSIISYNQQATLFYGSYEIDMYSQLFKLIIGFALCVVLIFGQNLKGIDENIRPEYYIFLFLSGLGLMMLVSAVELITLFVSLELSSFALYLLVPMRDDRTGVRTQMEAGIKYILFGVMATGFMLFGMSYLFGLTGSTYIKDIVPALGAVSSQPAAFFAVMMVLGGFFYKLAVFPMHFWVPDIYQGASNETTGFIATVPKLGAVALLIRFMTLPTGQPELLVNLLIVLALCSMFYGNLSALVQKDIKRMLGFSGISHAGFIVLGLLTMQASGYATAIYYITGYVLMNLACFLVISNVSVNGENLNIDDLNGLHKRQPVLAFVLAVGLFALGGIPPMVGFMGKFMLLTGALKLGHLTLVILAAFNTAIAIYY